MQRMFPRALLACISEARPPQPVEIEGLAAKIWREARCRRASISWSAVSRSSPEYRCAIAAAHLAFSGAPTQN